ncbi:MULTISPECIES: V-type ATP synthase subunit D [Aerococcus]|uniref:V-type ATP synthase subunit D n=1 Tax=Aerococcus sanguinicola TaxID=119206 RepID=A0A5N1GM55_9LACT|nr:MULTISPECIES: V-type ATP synthase subunit D [Aerococcus]KAA9302053.1 V-type ATP synthase subunit D [Aerococcus sanguinicola]MDK6368522.1 V-type ATP synthase subunit D [Aerococcus sp. UMB9870]MDK6679605.1 V-type ATP synthase subunit D [Aerococcus sp. UMB8608]MDK6686449.1 V-type ATP synthase subunit D [Aerococcus sp. UMB8623]MDK6940929.1 V-type ATP synthase subunit D [Aerococcus sp. UMB8487]
MDINAAPTRGNLMQVEKSLKLSRNGYNLMDRKRMILMNEIMTLSKQASQVQEELKEAYEEAYKQLSTATGEIGMFNVEQAAYGVPVSDALDIKIRSVMGTEIPETRLAEESLEPHYSLFDTTIAVDQARIAFERVKKLQVKLAEIENSAYRLANNIQKTQKRVNALQNITIPQLEEAQVAISSALEEKEREEFTRLKVVKAILANKAEEA